MGLIQRAIEACGIPTIGISIMRNFTESARPPRTVFLEWPMGHPLGEPGNVSQQTRVLHDALSALVEIKEPGTIIDLGYRWGRPEDISAFECACDEE